MAFSCTNAKFTTNLEKGFPHGGTNAKGSVFKDALFDDGTLSLWLEHVLCTTKGDEYECYWLMWYDKKGTPLLRASSVFDRDRLKTMVAKLTTINDDLLDGRAS